MKQQLQRLAAATATTLALTFATLSAHAATTVVDVSGAQSINLLGEANNTVWLVDIGANAALASLDWSLTLAAFAPSSLSEMQVSFSSSSGLNLLTFTPDAFGGTSDADGNGVYSGSLDLTPHGVAAGADGMLRIEFSEGYKDFAMGAVEGQWVSGNLTFDVTAAPVPEPASVALMLLGLGLIGVRLRRAPGSRRHAQATS